tara:strand:+ start:258 stop:443 length:186 start_codon:yes stop_codon:yes gene_type:complete
MSHGKERKTGTANTLEIGVTLKRDVCHEVARLMEAETEADAQKPRTERARALRGGCLLVRG